MGSMRHATHGLFAEVEATVLAEIERAGSETRVRANIVRRYSDRGVSRATLYRWVHAVLAPDGNTAAGLTARMGRASLKTTGQVDAGALALLELLSASLKVANFLIDDMRTRADSAARYQAAVLAEIEKESPAAAERIRSRMQPSGSAPPA